MLIQTKTDIENIANEIIELYEKFGNEDYIGEPVSQIEHMCQCAQLAWKNGANETVVLAAFFHDIGHLCEFQFPEKGLQHMDKFGIIDHEKLGAEFLRQKRFSEQLARLVENHVHAKRYLVYKYESYAQQLSEASKQTLIHQGGPMTETEAAEFEKDELFHEIIALRKWDELAKETNRPLPSLVVYKTMMIAHLSNLHNINLH